MSSFNPSAAWSTLNPTQSHTKNQGVKFKLPPKTSSSKSSAFHQPSFSSSNSSSSISTSNHPSSPSTNSHKHAKTFFLPGSLGGNLVGQINFNSAANSHSNIHHKNISSRPPAQFAISSFTTSHTKTAKHKVTRRYRSDLLYSDKGSSGSSGSGQSSLATCVDARLCNSSSSNSSSNSSNDHSKLLRVAIGLANGTVSVTELQVSELAKRAKFHLLCVWCYY